jgi:glycosyltransferase involved in cell wall biosynthesis
MSAVDRVTVTPSETPEHSRLRVLFVGHTYVVGVNQGKLKAIAQSATVGLLTPSNWKSLEWNRLLPPERPYSDFKIYEFPVALSGRGGAHFYAPWQVWRALRDFQPDVVQVEEEVFSLCALEFSLWARLTGKPLVVFGWENQARSLPLLRRWVRRYVLDTASLILAGNHDGAKLLYQWGYPGLVEVMPQLGVDPSFFQPTAKPPSAEFCIGFLGRLVPEKGIDTLLTAVKHLRSRHLNARLVICGSGSGETELRQAAVGIPVTWQKGVTHEQVPQMMAQFDVLVLPSRTTPTWKEQFGHVLIEAMAMGIPVVGSSSGEIPNVIGRSDLVFVEGDALALAQILQRLIEDGAWRQAVQQYCLTRVQQHYTHDRIAERLIMLWQKLLLKSQSGHQEQPVLEEQP